MKRILVMGAGGFIGSHLTRRLRKEGHWVRAVDLKYPEYSKTAADEFIIGDLRSQKFLEEVVDSSIDEIYQLAAEMGGAGYIFSGDHDADIMYNSAIINLNLLNRCRIVRIKKIFFTSSACIYPLYNQQDAENPKCSEDSAYPAAPDSEYGWEKLFCERIFLAFNRNYGMQTHIGRLHNVFGPEGAWKGGREKAPAAICRKVAEAPDGGSIEIWGDGAQTRSFLYIEECLEGINRLMNSRFYGPVNIGSERMVTINQLAKMIIQISGKKLHVRNVPGLMGVRGRNSDNRIIRREIGWAPEDKLEESLKKTYAWISSQVEHSGKIRVDP